MPLIATSDNLSWCPGHTEQRKPTFISCLLISRSPEWHTHKINKYNLKEKSLFKSSFCSGRKRFSRILRVPWRPTFHHQQQIPAVVFLNEFSKNSLSSLDAAPGGGSSSDWSTVLALAPSHLDKRLEAEVSAHNSTYHAQGWKQGASRFRWFRLGKPFGDEYF